MNEEHIINLNSELFFETIRDEQQREPTLRKLRDIMDGENYSINKNSKLWPFTSKIDELFIDDDDVLRRQSNDDATQIVLPQILHEPVLQILHEQPIAGHLGVEKTEARFVNQFYWPNIHAKIAEFIRHCHECAIRKPSPVNPTAPLQPIKTTRPLQCVELDFCGPFTQIFDGYK